MQTKNISLVCILLILPVFVIAKPVAWETSYENMVGQVSKNGKTEEFTPHKRPTYRNKIVSYISGLQGGKTDNITILRVYTNPTIDYLFVDKKLYSYVEDWGIISDKGLTTIHKELLGIYGDPKVKQTGTLTVSTFCKEDTLVMLYSDKRDNSTFKCKVYYYTKKVFYHLLSS